MMKEGVRHEGLVRLGDALKADGRDASSDVRGDVTALVGEDLPRHGVVLEKKRKYQNSISDRNRKVHVAGKEKSREFGGRTTKPKEYEVAQSEEAVAASQAVLPGDLADYHNITLKNKL